MSLIQRLESKAKQRFGKTATIEVARSVMLPRYSVRVRRGPNIQLVAYNHSKKIAMQMLEDALDGLVRRMGRRSS